MQKDKEKALNLLKQKINGEIKITYREITKQTGYQERHLIRLSQQIEKKGISSLLVHGNTGKKPSITASNQEIEYIKNFKKKYPIITISQFRDIYHEDIIWNNKMINDVKKYNLKIRSKSFFQQLFKKEGWKSPIKHKCFKSNKQVHSLRDPSLRRGILIMVDGTPHDWFGNGKKFSLHMAIDDATGEILAGWFMPTECILGYCHIFKIIFEKYGIPISIYSDRTTILWEKNDELTQVGRMLEELGIELIFANSPEAKGKIEKMNFTIQNRLLNDIIRFNIKTYDELNKWFNSYYIKYINKKFSYEPKEKETEFVPLDGKDLSTIFCIKDTRTILNGNMISVNNEYYIPIDEFGNDYVFYKGTKVEVWQDVFNPKLVRIFKNNKIYGTRHIEGHRQDPIKREQKRIDDQKMLEQVLRERDERLKARAKRS